MAQEIGGFVIPNTGDMVFGEDLEPIVTAITNILVSGPLNYRGTWDATNPPVGGVPTLVDGTGTKGDLYVVSVGGTQDLGSGAIDFAVGDWCVYNGTIWQKADHTDLVTSVFGRQGAVVAVAGDYAASEVSDDSLWGTASVKAALDALNAHAARHEGGADPITPAGIGAEPAFAKNTAFNKNFGIAIGDVPEIGAALGNSEIVETDGSGKLDSVAKNTAYNKAFGAIVGSVCEGNDARLSNARTPTAHDLGGAEHTADTIADFGTKLSDLGNDEILTSTGGGVLQGEAKAGAFNKAFGAGAGDVCQGNDGRLTDARTPTAHAASHEAGGSDVLTSMPMWEKFTKSYSDLAAAALTNDIELFQLPAGGVIHAVKIKHSTNFIGGAIASYTLSLGIAGTLAKYHTAFDVFQATGNTVQSVENNVDTENHGAATSIRLAATSTVANLDAATQGSVDVWVLKSVAV